MEAKEVKIVKLCGHYDGHQRVTELRISGVWLDKLGFDIGRTVEITSSKVEIVMKAKENIHKHAPQR